MKKLGMLNLLMAAFFLSNTALTVGPAEKWMPPSECLKRVATNYRVDSGKLFFKTPDKGVRLLYSFDGGEQKLAAYGEEIVVDKGQRLQIHERHTQIEILPLSADGKARFAVLLREDYRSFGKDLTVSVSVFDLGANEVIALAETEGRAALQAAREKAPANK